MSPAFIDNDGRLNWRKIGYHARSAFAVLLATFSLLIDFHVIEQGVKAGVPARYAWSGAFGLTVTLVWLYIEILRILAILRGE